MHTPTGMAILSGDTIAVYSSRRIQLVVWTEAGMEYVRDLTRGPPVSAVCQAGSHVLTRVAPHERRGTVRVIDRSGQEIVRYGSGFDHERDDVSAFFSTGGMACAGPYAATFFNSMPLLYGYDVSRGVEAWSTLLTDFRFPEVRLQDGGGIGLGSENASDMVLGLFGLPDGVFMVQVNRMGPQHVEDGRVFTPVERRDTYVLLAEIGAGIHVGEGLPHIIGVSGTTLQAVESDPVPQVINYGW